MTKENNEWILKIINSKKKTPVKAYIQGKKLPKTKKCQCFGDKKFRVLMGDLKDVQSYLEEYKDDIKHYDIELVAKNSAVGLMDLKNVNARIEPGAIIRNHVTIKDQAVIMMGAVINIGAVIGEKTMIDMGAVIGGRAIVGNRCHIGANAVLAGVIEPPSATPVIIEDDVLIGANAVIVEGIHIGKSAVVGAGSVVLSDVEAGAVVAGNPARVIKSTKDEKTQSKTEILDDLRAL